MPSRILLIILLFTAKAFSQTTTVVSGTVTDATTGKAILGAWVRARATYYATTTNAGGFFRLPAKPNGVLVISHGHYKTQRIKIKKLPNIAIQLQPQTVVELRKRLLDSSSKSIPIQTNLVTHESFNGGIITHPLQTLVGKIPGFVISKQGSNPDQPPTALVRGLNTLLIGSEPLYVVDDIPNVPIDPIPIEDIESVEVLRGASASLYGVRGANGVVLIKTKKSDSKTPSVQYQSWVGVETIARQPDLLNADEYRSLAKAYSSFADNDANTDWIAATTHPAFSTNHHLTLGKNTEHFNVRASFGYLFQQGNVKTVDSERITARMSIEQKLFNDRLTVGLHLSSSKFHRHLSPDSMFVHYLQSMRPTDPILSSNGTYFERPEVYLQANPVAYLKSTTNENKRFDGLGGLFLNYQLNRHLLFKLNTAWRIQNEDFSYYQGLETLAQERGIIGKGYRQGEARRENHSQEERFLEASLRYQAIVQKHSIDGQIGYAFQEGINEGFSAKNNGFITDVLSFNNLGAGSGISLLRPSAYGASDWLSSYHNQARYISFFGQLRYTLAQVFFAHLSLRRDGSSKFAQSHKWGLFPSFSAGWHLREMRFWGLWHFFQALTLRVNYGISGNSDGLASQRSQALMGALPQSPYYDGSNNTFKPSYGVIQLVNPTLQWEQTRNQGLGLDFAFFKNNIHGSLDWYKRRSSSVLWPTSSPLRYPDNYPQQAIFLNTGAIQNKGLEFSLEALLANRKSFKWRLQWTGAWNKNRLISMDENKINAYNSDKIYLGTPFISTLRNTYGLPLHILRADLPVGAFWGFITQGLDKNGNFIYSNTPFDMPNSAYLGNPQPNFTTGLTNHFSYKHWQISFVWNGRFGNQLLNLNRIFMATQVGRFPNANALHESLNSPIKDTRTSFNNYWLENGNFLRLDNTVIRYHFKTCPQIRRMSAFISGNNLILLTKYSGIDPEIDLGSIRSGVEYTQFFYKSRGFNAGFQVEF